MSSGYVTLNIMYVLCAMYSCVLCRKVTQFETCALAAIHSSPTKKVAEL